MNPLLEILLTIAAIALTLVIVVSVGSILEKKSAEKLKAAKALEKTPAQAAMMGMAQQLEQAMFKPKKLEVYQHRSESLYEYIIVYDPETEIAENKTGKWLIGKPSLKRNYVYIGEL